MSRLDNGYTDTLRDVQKVFRHSVILKAGVPVYIHDAEGGDAGVKSLIYSELPLDNNKPLKMLRAPISDDDWALSPMRLGYVNNLMTDRDTLSCGYCIRTPFRRVQQGLHQQNVSLPAQNPGYLIARYSFGHLIYAQGFSESLTGTYPSLVDALAKVSERDGGVDGMAFSRRWAIRIDQRLRALHLEYRGRRVAA